MVRSFKDRLDALVSPARLGESDPVALLRARIVLIASVVFVLLAGTALVFRLITGAEVSPFRQVLIVGFLLGLSTAALVLVVGRRPRLAVRIFVIALAIPLAFGTLLTGGELASIKLTFPVFALLGLFLLGPVAGALFTLVVAAGLQLLPRFVEAASVSPEKYSRFFETHFVLATLGTIGVAYAYEYARRTRERELHLKQVEALSLARSQRRFLATMSHEIRTPLNGILGCTELALGVHVKAEREVLLRQVQSSGNHLLELINDILDISKLDAGAVALRRAPLELQPFLEHLAGLYEPLAMDAGIEICLDIDTTLPDHVNEDGVRLRQVLANLVSNAVKFTKKGVVRISARRAGGPEGTRLRFEVRDNGPGVSAEEAAQLFERFVQTERAHSDQTGGTGLGLAISHELVGLMDGEIGVVAAVAPGACFFVELPLRPAAAPTTTLPAVEASPAPDGDPDVVCPDAPTASLRVLIAEDNPVNRLVATRMVEQLGHEVACAVDGLEALDAVCAAAAGGAPFHTVLMDCQMPEVDGLEATRRIRALGETIAQPRVLALTANVVGEAEAECVKAGMDGFLSKPITLERLEKALAEAS